MSPSGGTELEELPKGKFLVKSIKELIFFFGFILVVILVARVSFWWNGPSETV